MKLMYINGEFTKGNSQREIEVTNPATEEPAFSNAGESESPDIIKIKGYFHGRR